MSSVGLRWPQWQGAGTALLAAAFALGAALVIPSAFSDPNGVDPHVLRLSGVALILLGASLVNARLAAARPVLLVVASVTTSFSLWSATPGLVEMAFPGHLGSPQQLALAGLAQVAVTTAYLGLTMLVVPPKDRPALRLRPGGGRAVLAGGLGITLFAALMLSIPAPLLGREGMALAALARDGPWLIPAAVLQAAAQELQFRGQLLGVLERVAPPTSANAVQALAFGATHLAVLQEGPVAPLFVVTVLLGLALGAATRWSGSLWPALAVHAVADAAVIAAVLPGLYGY